MGNEWFVHRLKADHFGTIRIAADHHLPGWQEPVLHCLPILEKPLKCVEDLLRETALGQVFQRPLK